MIALREDALREDRALRLTSKEPLTTCVETADSHTEQLPAGGSWTQRDENRRNGRLGLPPEDPRERGHLRSLRSVPGPSMPPSSSSTLVVNASKRPRGAVPPSPSPCEHRPRAGRGLTRSPEQGVGPQGTTRTLARPHTYSQ